MASFTATGQSSTFPLHGDFMLEVTGTFVGTVELQRKCQDGTWLTLWPSDIYAITDQRVLSGNEPVYGAIYRWNCTAYTSGTINANAYGG